MNSESLLYVAPSSIKELQLNSSANIMDHYLLRYFIIESN